MRGEAAKKEYATWAKLSWGVHPSCKVRTIKTADNVSGLVFLTVEEVLLEMKVYAVSLNMVSDSETVKGKSEVLHLFV